MNIYTEPFFNLSNLTSQITGQVYDTAVYDMLTIFIVMAFIMVGFAIFGLLFRGGFRR